MQNYRFLRWHRNNKAIKVVNIAHSIYFVTHMYVDVEHYEIRRLMQKLPTSERPLPALAKPIVFRYREIPELINTDDEEYKI